MENGKKTIVFYWNNLTKSQHKKINLTIERAFCPKNYFLGPKTTSQKELQNFKVFFSFKIFKSRPIK